MYHQFFPQMVSDASDDVRGGARLEPAEAIEVRCKSRRDNCCSKVLKCSRHRGLSERLYVPRHAGLCGVDYRAMFSLTTDRRPCQYQHMVFAGRCRTIRSLSCLQISVLTGITTSGIRV